ncbi:MAG: hypothetical protein HOC09_06070 [Deltaproteobacteria bacterium]|jgi:hypothetical protein|nr:hypothetical protein [Deltaproteobacteria bacterium]
MGSYILTIPWVKDDARNAMLSIIFSVSRKRGIICVDLLVKLGIERYEKEKSGGFMDLFITGILALLAAVLGAAVALITHRPKLKILTYAFIGLILGIAVGYAVAPFILSFY